MRNPYMKAALLLLVSALLAVGCKEQPPSDRTPAISAWRARVAVGGRHSLSIAPDGTLWAWGNNSSGQLGDGSTTVSTRPVRTLVLDQVRAVAAGESHSLALRTDGTVWAWGNNTSGQLGDGTTGNTRAAPVQASGLTGVVAVAVGYAHSLALRADGTVWAWGYNLGGEVGDGTTGNTRAAPVQVSGLTDVVAVAAGGQNSLALRSDGTVWVWGNRAHVTPAQVPGLTGMVAVAAGDFTLLAVRSDGTVWSFRSNFSITPVQVAGLSDVVAVTEGYAHSLALRTDGTLWAWGWNDFGQLGDGTGNQRLTPGQVEGIPSVVAAAAGSRHTLVVHPDGTIRAWGYNQYGQLGDGNASFLAYPVRAPSP